MKRAVKGLLWTLGTFGVIAAAIVAWLVYPGTPSYAQHLAFQGYILLPKSNSLTVLDYLTINNNQLFIADESTGSVHKISLHPDSPPGIADVSTLASEPAAHGVAIDPVGGMAYVSRSEANTVDVFDPLKMKFSKRIPVADDPDGIFYEPQHNLIYVANGDAHTATLIDPAVGATVASITLDGRPEYAAYDPGTQRMYQNLRDENSVIAVDLDSRAVANRWVLPGCEGPTGMALDEENRRLFILCSSNARLVVFDLTRKSVTETIKIGGGPDSVAYDKMLHRIYTTGKSGILVVIQQDTPDDYHVIDSVRLHYGAHTLALDPDTHRLYVGYAGLLVPPRVAVFTSLP